mmetsp:Transcript_7691/g.10616  ORF Transcript_7691/g.10616 Transcript_7691/m.10616 type:complete len:105 (+) Transcript_7691:610-924(+)
MMFSKVLFFKCADESIVVFFGSCDTAGCVVEVDVETPVEAAAGVPNEIVAVAGVAPWVDPVDCDSDFVAGAKESPVLVSVAAVVERGTEVDVGAAVVPKEKLED